jgi:hypothetical protein
MTKIHFSPGWLALSPNITGLYVSGAGFPDQFGGGKGKKFMVKNYVNCWQSMRICRCPNKKITGNNL